MDLWDHSAWPEHREDLLQVLFGHAVLEFYAFHTVVTTNPVDIDQIIKKVAKHPLNVAKNPLEPEEAKRFWEMLVPHDQETCTLNEIKAEVLRQVRLYVNRGLEVLKSAPAVTEEPKPELQETVVEEETGVKRSSTEEEHATEDKESGRPQHSGQSSPEPESSKFSAVLDTLAENPHFADYTELMPAIRASASKAATVTELELALYMELAKSSIESGTPVPQPLLNFVDELIAKQRPRPKRQRRA